MQDKYYKKSFWLSAVLHIAILILLTVSLKFTPQLIAPQNDHAMQIVNAVTINQNQVQKEMEKIKQEKLAKKRAEISHQKHLEHLAHKARIARLHEQKRLATLKAQQQKLDRARQSAEKRAAQKLRIMQNQIAETQKRLADIKKQQSKQKSLIAKNNLQKDLEQQLAKEEKQLNATHIKQTQTIVNKYKALILNAIGQHWILPKNIDKTLSTQLLIQLAPGGMVLNVRILKSSGNTVLDRSAMTAIRQASPLPVPKQKDAFEPFRELHLTVKPQGLIG